MSGKHIECNSIQTFAWSQLPSGICWAESSKTRNNIRFCWDYAWAKSLITCLRICYINLFFSFCFFFYYVQFQISKTQMNLCPKYIFFSYLLKTHAFSQDFFCCNNVSNLRPKKEKNLIFYVSNVRLGVQKNLHVSIHHRRIVNLGKGGKKIFLAPADN